MKQKLLLLALALTASIGYVKAQSSADDLVSIPKVTIMQGKKAELIIMSNFDYSNHEAGYGYTGTQVEFKLPTGISAVKSSLVISSTVKDACPNMIKGFTSASETDGRTIILVYQMGGEEASEPVDCMTEGQYEICHCLIECADNVTPGTYQGTTTKIEITDNSRPIQKFNIANLTFDIEVIEYKPRDLYDDIVEVEENTGKVEDVIIHRSFNKDKWATICLPFAMTLDQMEDVFGKGTKLAEFTEYDYAGETDNIIMKFVSATNGIEANYPYIICPTQEVENIFVEDVLVAPEEDDAIVEYENGKSGNRKVTWAQFIGTLKQGVFEDKVTDKDHTPGQCFLFINNNKFYVSTSAKTIKAYRGYFWVDVVEESYAPANISIMVDGDLTSIEELTTPSNQTVDGNVYTVSGINLGRAEDVMESLPSGIYIVNNKKVIVK